MVALARKEKVWPRAQQGEEKIDPNALACSRATEQRMKPQQNHGNARSCNSME
jgi:hypothetical protein